MKYPKMDWETMEAIVDELGGMEGVYKLLSKTPATQVTSRVLKTFKGFNPIAFIGENWKIIKSEIDHRATILEQIDFERVNLENCLKLENNGSITGEEKLTLLKENGNIRLGVETFMALWQEEDHKTLEWFYGVRGVIWLDFFGTILESPSGCRYILCLYRDQDNQWKWRYRWLDGNWRGRLSAISLTPITEKVAPILPNTNLENEVT